MLDIQGLSVSYGKHRALDGVSIKVAPGEIVVILGANGAGKSTLLKAIAGICEGRVSGNATMNGEPLLGLAPHRVVERGVALVPEGRGIFGDLSVRDNLLLGANPDRARADAAANLARLTGLFPKLEERSRQTARTMSGGEQQMVAIGRAMMSNPVILMLDEPSLGLSPLLSKELFQNLKAVRAAGLGILLVEQNARLSLGIADRGYLLENGEILREDRAEILRDDPAVQAAYLGGASGKGHAAPALRPASAAPKAAEVAPVAELPPSVTVRQRPVASISAGQISGLDIGALVARASARATPSDAPARRTTPLPPQLVAQATAARPDRLRKLLDEMEAAAQGARQRSTLAPMRPLAQPAMQPGRPASAFHGGVASAPAASAPTDNSETRGKVTVYRRRPGTSQFDRMES